MTPFLAAALDDIDALVALRPDIATGLIEANGAAGIVLEGLPLDAGQVLSGLIAVIVLSEAGRVGAEGFIAGFRARFGGDAPPVIDLVAEADPAGRKAALQTGMIAALLRGQTAQARRNAGLMGDLSQMRTTYARVQDSFARLEDHVWRNGLADRQQTFALEPPVATDPLILPPRAVLRQRLPRDAQGLCDVALLVANPPPEGEGHLRVTLSTAEDGEIHAEWQIPVARLQPGWLRLSLQAALDADARAAFVRLDWAGSGNLGLALAMRHPDPRFQCVFQPEADAPEQETGRVLALRGWHYVPGCAAPAPSDGMFPGGRTVRRLMIPGDTLATAVNLRPANQPYLYLADSNALLLHISPGATSVGVLAAGVPDQTTRISTKIMTRAAGGPPIEYAFAVAPAAGEPVPGADLPAFDPGHITEWQRLMPMIEGELHLDLAAPLLGAHDLYMLTRLPEGVEDASWGWATFTAFRLIL
ncbi:MAG: DUF6212 domain-containing protein [Paracoccaceae bacterium]